LQGFRDFASDWLKPKLNAALRPSQKQLKLILQILVTFLRSALGNDSVTGPSSRLKTSCNIPGFGA
jgi:hypothetical protein